MASRSSAMVRRITISVWRTFLASAGHGMRFAVRRCAREAVTMVGDPAVDHVLDEPDAGDAVDQQRQPGAQGDRPCSVPRLGTAVDGAGRVQPPHGFQQPIMGNPKALRHTHALQWLGLDIARPVVPDQEIVRASAHPAGPVEEQNSGHTLIVHRDASSVTAWRADMTDVMRNTVSPAYSAVWSTADSGIPIVGATGENIGRLGIWMRVRGA